MPHIGDTRYAVVSCHVERPLDDEVWRRSRGSGAPAGRLPDRGAAAAARPGPARTRRAGSSGRAGRRARAASATTRTGRAPTHARPTGGDPAERVRARGRSGCASRASRRASSAAAAGTSTRRVAGALAELGYADCTATSLPAALPARRRAAALARRARRGSACRRRRLLELPTTRSLGMAARAAIRAQRRADPPRLLPRHRSARPPPRARARARPADPRAPPQPSPTWTRSRPG